MRISDWSSDVCSSDLPIPDHPSKPEFEAPKLWWNPSISPGGMMIYTGDLFPQYKGSAFIAALSGEALIRVELNGTSARPAEQWNMDARSEEHTSELQSLMRISYAVFCLKKTNKHAQLTVEYDD